MGDAISLAAERIYGARHVEIKLHCDRTCEHNLTGTCERGDNACPFIVANMFVCLVDCEGPFEEGPCIECENVCNKMQYLLSGVKK